MSRSHRANGDEVKEISSDARSSRLCGASISKAQHCGVRSAISIDAHSVQEIHGEAPGHTTRGEIVRKSLEITGGLR
jgi:hypothetical protein